MVSYDTFPSRIPERFIIRNYFFQEENEFVKDSALFTPRFFDLPLRRLALPPSAFFPQG
jgi:hypothetical protein